MNNRNMLIFAGLFLFAISFGFADVIPGRWEKVDSLQPGSSIIVELVSGDKIECRVVSLTPEALTVRAEGGETRSFPRDSVNRVLTMRSGARDALYGAAIGGAAGVVTGLLVSSQFDETFFARADLMSLTCGGIGALAGALIGNAVVDSEREEVIYRKQ